MVKIPNFNEQPNIYFFSREKAHDSLAAITMIFFAIGKKILF